MGNRPSMDRRFKKINVSWETENHGCSGAQEVCAYSRHGVVKAKLLSIDLWNHRRFQGSQTPGKRAAVRGGEVELNLGRFTESLRKEQLASTSTQPRHF